MNKSKFVNLVGWSAVFYLWYNKQNRAALFTAVGTMSAAIVVYKPDPAKQAAKIAATKEFQARQKQAFLKISEGSR